ncbi:MAG: hypothetical protein LBC98_01995 [Prevotellaceae bacterium]|nr:hypothetical protein [Prevotellaceae bacterium]
MKKLLILPAIALMFGVAFSSCKKDESNIDVAGTYKGELAIPALGQAPADTIKNVNLTMVKESSGWQLKLNQDITIGGIPMPLNVVCPVSTSDKDGKVNIQGNTIVAFPEPINTPFVGEVTEMPVVVNGNIDGNGNAVINLLMMGGVMNVTFTGKK